MFVFVCVCGMLGSELFEAIPNVNIIDRFNIIRNSFGKSSVPKLRVDSLPKRSFVRRFVVRIDIMHTCRLDLETNSTKTMIPSSTQKYSVNFDFRF